MIRYRYNSEVQPPAPFVTVALQNVVTGVELQNVPAQLDTGAYRTVLPLSVAQALDLAPLGTIKVQGVGGVVADTVVYAVSLGVHDLPADDFEVLAHEGEDWVLLGRDVLNTLQIFLNGPAHKLEIL